MPCPSPNAVIMAGLVFHGGAMVVYIAVSLKISISAFKKGKKIVHQALDAEYHHHHNYGR